MVITIARLMGVAMIMAGISMLLYLADRKTAFGRRPQWLKQLFIGMIYGGLAICGTEFGVKIGGATANIRDAAPLCAGLLFGMPAGIIAGVIGGAERWFAALWGAGTYTRLACSLATALAGLFSAALRKYMFDNKKPSWIAALFVGLVMEVLHMLLIFITNMSDIHTAFRLVEGCAAPMILANGTAVALSAFLISIIGGRKGQKKADQQGITQRFQSLLTLCVATAFLCTCAFTLVLQTRLSDSSADELLALNIADVKADIEDASDANLLKITREIVKELDKAAKPDSAYLKWIAKRYDLPEIDLIDPTGLLYASTNPDFVGYNMASGEQSAEFLVLLNGRKEYVQSYQPISYDDTLSRKYAGAVLAAGGFVQVAYDAERFQSDIGEQIVGETRNRHVGESGAIIICDKDGIIVSDSHGYEGQSLDSMGLFIDESVLPQNVTFTINVLNEPSVCQYVITEGYKIIAFQPEDEAKLNRNLSIYIMAFMEIVLFAAVFIQIYVLIKRVIVDNIHKINGSLSMITSGNLDITVNVRDSAEFASLSDDINATVHTLKRYIAEAEARIDRELAFAKEIQHSALPSCFPPYPDRHEFDLYATMETAKEVGGDFYDFYFVTENKLAFLVADVSGKGIPASLFMMRAKTLIKSLAESGLSLDEVFTKANQKLCESNDAGMFVTAWLGLMDVTTGFMEFVNAGHNPPLIKRKNGRFEYLKSRAGFVLAGMEGITYRKNMLQLQPSDTIFLYTDGVTEATDGNAQLFGDDRLASALNEIPDAAPEALLATVHRNVNSFVGSEPQFDDITMLALTYHGSQTPLKEWRGTPELSAMEAVTAFVENTLTETDCPISIIMKMNIATDEIFSNIAHYSGAKNAVVSCGVQNGTAVLCFTDDGEAYDPTMKKEPNTALSIQERTIGGLGLLMVKKSMDSMEYHYVDGQNQLTIRKKIGT